MRGRVPDGKDLASQRNIKSGLGGKTRLTKGKKHKKIQENKKRQGGKGREKKRTTIFTADGGVVRRRQFSGQTRGREGLLQGSRGGGKKRAAAGTGGQTHGRSLWGVDLHTEKVGKNKTHQYTGKEKKKKKGANWGLKNLSGSGTRHRKTVSEETQPGRERQECTELGQRLQQGGGQNKQKRGRQKRGGRTQKDSTGLLGRETKTGGGALVGGKRARWGSVTLRQCAKKHTLRGGQPGI